MTEAGTDLVIPSTGEIVDLSEPRAVADAVAELEALERQVRAQKDRLRDLLVAESRRLGTKTLRWGKREVTIKGGSMTVYDADAIEAELLEAGMPAEQVAEIVVEKVTIEKRVDARRAKRAADVNPEYAAILERHSTVVEQRHSVTVT